jgi:hypothetical protein
MKVVCLLLLTLLGLPFTLYGQKSYEGRNITEGKIITSDSREIYGFNVFISNDTVEYYDKGLTERHTLELNQVKEIQESHGNWATTGTWVGCLIGCGVGVGVAIATETTTSTNDGSYIYTQTTIQTWPIYIIGLAGAGLGYLVGSNAHDWKTIYSKDMAFLNSFDICVNRKMNGVFLTYRLEF